MIVEISQTHSANQGVFYEMPIPIRFSNGPSQITYVFNQSSPNDTLFFEFPNFAPTVAVFDPDIWLCAKGVVNKVNVPVKTIHWTGDQNNLWGVSQNWDCGIPTLNDDVIIPIGTPDCILLNFNSGICRNMKIEKGAKVITLDGADLQIGD